MAALDNPAALIDPFEFGEWAKRPEIQQALNARQQIREIREQDALAADRRIAIDTLKAVIEANKDLKDDTQRLESRRAASAILRIIGAATRQASSAAFSSPSFPFTRLRPRVRPAPDIPPDRVAMLAATALARPTDEALADVAPFLTTDSRGDLPDPECLAFSLELDSSPATAVRAAVTGRTHDHVHYSVTLARRDRPPNRFAVSLIRHDRSPRRDCWLVYGLTEITEPAPAPPASGTHSANTS